MTAGAVSATVPSIVLVSQLSEFRQQIAEVRTYLGICGLARRHWLWTPGPPLYKAKPEILWREWCTTPVTNTVIIQLPLPPAERWEAHVRRQDLLPEIEDVRMQMTDHACVSRHSRGKCYGRRDHQSTRQSQRFCCVNGAQPQSRTQSQYMYPYRHSGKDAGLDRQTEAANGVFEASWTLLGGFGQAFGESWAALWGAFGAS